MRNQHASITVLEILPCDRPPVAIIASGLSHAQINHFDFDSNCIFPIDPINCALARSQKHNKTNQEWVSWPTSQNNALPYLSDIKCYPRFELTFNIPSWIQVIIFYVFLRSFLILIDSDCIDLQLIFRKNLKSNLTLALGSVNLVDREINLI